MYYANASATTASNGDNTFEFFDDFLGSSLDTSKWGQSISGSVTTSISNSIITLSTSANGASNHIRSNSSVGHISINQAVRAKVKTTHFSVGGSPYYYAEYIYLIYGSANQYSSLFFAFDASLGKKFASNSGSGWVSFGDISGWNANVWHTYDLIRNGNTNLIKKVDDVNTQTATSAIVFTSAYIAIQTGGTNGMAGSNQSYDWILVREYNSSEPTSFFGAEQNN